eukprot:5102739-Amphidinium_carterae.1
MAKLETGFTAAPSVAAADELPADINYRVDCGLCVLVPLVDCWPSAAIAVLLRGRQGATLKEIRDSCGCRIHIDKEEVCGRVAPREAVTTRPWKFTKLTIIIMGVHLLFACKWDVVTNLDWFDIGITLQILMGMRGRPITLSKKHSMLIFGLEAGC